MEPKSLMKLCRDGESASTTPENSLLMPLSRARSFATPPRFPFGIDDLNPDPSRQPGDPSLARCYVRGCPHILTRPARGKRGRACPEHGIYCHRSCTGGTYSYADASRNIIAGIDWFRQRILRHPFKYESHRMGQERSEDAVSWNVFRSLQEARRLSDFVRLATGEAHSAEPQLFLWGIRLTDDAFDAWPLLIASRQRFESKLPVDRPQTEPDIALHLPGKYLILIEAKFTSPNTYYLRGPRKDKSSLTLDELLSIYDEPDQRILNRDAARAADRVFYQLWRNMVFAEWMARFDSPGTRAYHLNLVRSGYEQATAKEFAGLITAGFEDRFGQITWEQIHGWSTGDERLSTMCEYLRTKTAGLTKAFSIE